MKALLSLIIVLIITLSVCSCAAKSNVDSTDPSNSDQNAVTVAPENPTSSEEPTSSDEMISSEPVTEDIPPSEPITEASEPITEATEPITEATEPTAAASDPITTTSEATSSEAIPTISYNISEISGVRYAKDDVNVRKSPSVSGERIGHLNKGEKVDITGLVDNGWVRIKFKGGEYFVSGNYLSEAAIADVDSPSTLINSIEIPLPDGYTVKLTDIDRIVYQTANPSDIDPETSDPEQISEILTVLKNIEFGEPYYGGWVGGTAVLFFSNNERVVHMMIGDNELWFIFPSRKEDQDGMLVYPIISGGWTNDEWNDCFIIS